MKARRSSSLLKYKQGNKATPPSTPHADEPKVTRNLPYDDFLRALRANDPPHKNTPHKHLNPNERSPCSISPNTSNTSIPR